MSQEKKAVIIASITAIILIIIKGTAGILTGSMAIITSAIDSAMDFFVSLMNFLAIRKSEEPHDEDHNYGHGKIEGFGAIFEGLVIFLSGIAVIYFSIQKIINHEYIHGNYESILVMIISILITFALVIYLSKISKLTGSLVLKADSLHYKSDLYTNLGIIISLIILKVFNLPIIDPIISIIIALYIMYGSLEILQEGYKMLMDHAIDEEYVEFIKNTINSFKEISSYHFLKTRQSGKNNFIEFHIVFGDPNILLKLAHIIGDKIELKIMEQIPNAHIIIHLDYFDDSSEINNPKVLVNNK
ncbi:MAG: cation diffusion facilitator family transporter [Candidatus Gracilibacteria bacterium]|nr:cation diffusion facilitator family transporter [Candidatus Gracilibacteria bacterium]MDD2908874.1 cation diffusion facilitator family transporter [Candidatus Gracilibacteria bacterium]